MYCGGKELKTIKSNTQETKLVSVDIAKCQCHLNIGMYDNTD